MGRCGSYRNVDEDEETDMTDINEDDMNAAEEGVGKWLKKQWQKATGSGCKCRKRCKKRFQKGGKKTRNRRRKKCRKYCRNNGCELPPFKCKKQCRMCKHNCERSWSRSARKERNCKQDCQIAQ